MDQIKDTLNRNAKAVIAFFAPVLTYIAGQLATDEPINWALAASFAIGAFLVWAKPNGGQ